MSATINNSHVVRFLLVDQADDESAETGRAPTTTICPVGATAFQTPTNNGDISELGLGHYEITLTSDEVGSSKGRLIFEATGTGSDRYREYIEVKDGTEPVTVAANNILSGYELSAAGVEAFMDAVVEVDGDGNNITVRQVLSGQLCLMSGKSDGGGAAEGQITFRNMKDTATRLTLTDVTPGTGDRDSTGTWYFDDLP